MPIGILCDVHENQCLGWPYAGQRHSETWSSSLGKYDTFSTSKNSRSHGLCLGGLWRVVTVDCCSRAEVERIVRIMLHSGHKSPYFTSHDYGACELWHFLITLWLFRQSTLRTEVSSFLSLMCMWVILLAQYEIRDWIWCGSIVWGSCSTEMDLQELAGMIAWLDQIYTRMGGRCMSLCGQGNSDLGKQQIIHVATKMPFTFKLSNQSCKYTYDVRSKHFKYPIQLRPSFDIINKTRVRTDGFCTLFVVYCSQPTFKFFALQLHTWVFTLG